MLSQFSSITELAAGTARLDPTGMVLEFGNITTIGAREVASSSPLIFPDSSSSPEFHEVVRKQETQICDFEALFLFPI